MGNLKILRLSDSAFRLWIKALCYCQTHLTDGLLPREALREMHAKRRDVDLLSEPIVEGKAPLWEKIDGFGFKVHDYLDWNDSKEVVQKRSAAARERKERWKTHAERVPLAIQPNQTKPSSSQELSISATAVAPQPDVVTWFPVVGMQGKQWPLSEAQIAEWAESFPNLDIRAECLKAKAWLHANAGRQKTSRGMLKFLVGWLSRAVDRGGRGTAVPAHSPTTQVNRWTQDDCPHTPPCGSPALCDIQTRIQHGKAALV